MIKGILSNILPEAGVWNRIGFDPDPDPAF
jgi:hypothetical protein